MYLQLTMMASRKKKKKKKNGEERRKMGRVGCGPTWYSVWAVLVQNVGRVGNGPTWFWAELTRHPGARMAYHRVFQKLLFLQ